MKLQFDLPDIAATDDFARKLAAAIDRPITLALNGTLGAGKTQFARFLSGALGVAVESVTSPTYVLLQRYRGNRFEIYHFDFYRLENAHQVWDLGFDELQESSAILLVEWAEKFPETLPPDHITVQLSVVDSEHTDKIQIDKEQIDCGREADLSPDCHAPCNGTGQGSQRRRVEIGSTGHNSLQIVQRLKS